MKIAVLLPIWYVLFDVLACSEGCQECTGPGVDLAKCQACDTHKVRGFVYIQTAFI